MRNHRLTIHITMPLILLIILSGCSIFREIGTKPAPEGEVRFHLQEGDKYLSEGNYQEAVKAYNKAIDKNPKSIEARKKLGEAYGNTGNIDLAMEEFAKITEIDPKYIHAYNYRGFLYNNQGRWEEAAKEFELALDIEPDNLYSINHIGLMYKMLGKFDEAKDTLQRAIELDPEMDDPESKNTRNFLGLVYQDEAKYEEAAAEYRKVLEHFPADAETYNYLGSAYENLKLYREAAKQYNAALSIDPENSFAISRLEVLQQAGVRIIELDPVDIVVDDVESYIANAPDSGDYPNASAIILLDKLSYDATDTGLARYTIHQVVKILDKRAIEAFGEVAIPYNALSQNISVNLARTFLPDGTIVEAAADAEHDVTPPGLSEYNLYSNILYRIIIMPALQPGAILEYKVTLEDAAPTTEGFWILGGMAFQWVEPILASKCVVRMPKDLKLKWKLYNCQIDPVITTDEIGRQTYIWISKDNPAVVPEIAMPPFEEVIPYLMFSTVDSWDEVYKWYKELAEPQEIADQNIKRKTAELIAGKGTDEEKAKAIFEFVASEIRYVAIELGQGAYQPYPATDVFKYKYGDCKDKTTLLITMLREAGIEAYQVLISPAPARITDIDIPSIAQFSHVIAAVPQEDGSYVWLDPTADTCKYGDLPAGDQGRRAFVIKKEKGEFVDTPIFPSERNRITSTSELALMSDGTIKGWEQTTANGQADMYLKSIYRLIKPDKLKNFMEINMNQRYPGLMINNVSISDLYDTDSPIEMKVDFSCPDYGLKYGDIVTFPLPSEGFSDYATLVGSWNRQYDFHLGYNMEMEKFLTISIPEGYKVADLPKDELVIHDLGTFTRKYEEIDPSTIRYSVSLKITKPIIPAASYGNLKKLMETAAREDRAQIVFKSLNSKS